MASPADTKKALRDLLRASRGFVTYVREYSDPLEEERRFEALKAAQDNARRILSTPRKPRKG
jgi:hypothetical protein